MNGDYGPEEAAMQAYLRDGERRATALGNRGPIRFTPAGELHPEIVEAYWRCGFYVFEGVLKPDELADIERDLHDIIDRLPVEKGAAVDAKGRPALGVDCKGPNLHWARPLSDPWGGTSAANGRHPVKMHEPVAAANLPKEVVFLILGSLQFSEASLRVYGHPGLLGVAAAINGPGLRAVQRGAVDQGAGQGRLGGLAPGRHDALGQPGLGRGHPRLQLHGPALRLHRRQRRVGRAGLAQAGQDRHQEAGRRGRHRAAARRRADHLRAGRRRHDQPPGAARLVRQHQPELAGDGELRLPSPQVGAGRDRRAASTTPSRPTTPTASASAPA